MCLPLRSMVHSQQMRLHRCCGFGLCQLCDDHKPQSRVRGMMPFTSPAHSAPWPCSGAV